jgi:hypothetical protein
MGVFGSREMASTDGGTPIMRVNWVVTADYDPGLGTDLKPLHDIGPFWGSWQSWRACGTDNVICYEMSRCQELLKRRFQDQCNFYMPRKHFQSLGRPSGVSLYEGDYQEYVLGIEDIVSLHLAAPSSDLILMLGWDLSLPPPMEDRFEAHRLRNRLGLIRRVMVDYPDVQWVIIDAVKTPDKSYTDLPNVTCDNMNNVLSLLSSSTGE